MKAAGINYLNQRKHSHQDEMFGTEIDDVDEISCRYQGGSWGGGSTIEAQQKMTMHRMRSNLVSLTGRKPSRIFQPTGGGQGIESTVNLM